MPTPMASDTGDTGMLPSLYSPPTPAVDADRGRAQAQQPLSDRKPPQMAQQPQQLVDQLSLSPCPPATAGALDTLPQSLPSLLLSPNVTPPQTPGTQTPIKEVPAGVPVDSSLPSGGCGSKKPRLLDTLPQVQCIVRARIPTVAGTEMFLHLYNNNVDSKEHLAIVFGNNIRSKSLDAPVEGETEMDRMVRGAYTGRLFPGRTTSGSESRTAAVVPVRGANKEEMDKVLEAEGHKATSRCPGPPLVRIHSECYTGETAWSARCDCGEQLDEAARLMGLPSNADAGGIIIYLRQEGRGIGLREKLKAYNLQDLGSDTVEANLLLRHPADARSYGLATAMLQDLGQKEVCLLTNNPDKIRAVEGPNREIVVKERVAMVPLSWKGQAGLRSQEMQGYLKTKIEKMGHLLDMKNRL